MRKIKSTSRAAMLADFSQRTGTCSLCRLCRTRRQVVIGRGNVPARVVFIGEAPGVSEDLLGKPFIGPSGKLLDEMLKHADFTAKYFITNTVFCRPTDSLEGDNREPEKEEAGECKRHVRRLLDILCPMAVVFVGKVASRFLKTDLKKYRQFDILHPPYILRQGGKSSPLFEHNVTMLRDVQDFINGKGE